jgi:chemotaxis protein MotB
MTSGRAAATRARLRRRHPGEQSGEGRDRWLISYADLVTLLFALFVVLFAAADHERAALIARSIATQLGDTEPSGQENSGNGLLPGADSLLAEQAAINRAFANNQSLVALARVKRTDRGIVISLAEAGFFAPGDASLREDASVLIDELANALRDSSAPIRVEGHTDSMPINNARYHSNWELSTARASSVVARLLGRGVQSSRLSAAGYADERPVADNATPEGRALNRRVDLVILSQKN